MRKGGGPWSRRRSLATAVAVAAVVALAGTACSGGGHASPAKGPNGGLDTSHPYGGDPATEGTPVNGGILKVGMDREPASFDPANPAAVQNNEAASAIYDSLLKLDDEGQPQPYLAKSMSTPDAGTTWTLTLRPGVKFQDGTPLDADAVVFNVRRSIDQATAPGHIFTERIRSVSAVDPLTVRFVLTAPFGSFPNDFALPFSGGNLGAIASPTAVRKWGAQYGQHPVGAGPFSFAQWIPDSKIVLKKFTGYWQKGLPHLDGIEFHPLSDTETRYASVVNGDVDLIFAGYQTELYRSSQNKSLVTYYGLGGGAEIMFFNFDKPPFNDRRMREALIRAIDPKAMSATQFSNAMSPADTSFAPDDPLYSAAAAKEWPTYDPAKAKSLIASYRASGGDPDFTLDAPNSPNRVLFATFVQAQLAAVGLKIKVNFSDLAKFSGTIVTDGDFQLATFVDGPWDNPYPAMYNLLHTDGNFNYGGYHNAEEDKVLDDAVATTDPAKRTADYQQAQVIANKDLAIDWYSRGYLGTITRTNVKGVVRYLDREMFWATTWLSK